MEQWDLRIDALGLKSLKAMKGSLPALGTDLKGRVRRGFRAKLLDRYGTDVFQHLFQMRREHGNLPWGFSLA